MKIKEPTLQLSLDFARKDINFNLIDEQFDVNLANDLAKIESFNKHLYRPNTYLHKWWARRCGTTFRAILKHLVQDQLKSDFYSPGGLEGQIILDPMMGGGTTIHEAIRLGANVVGADIDPIPVLQTRASLSETPLFKLETTFHEYFDKLYSELGHYFRATCPYCNLSFEQKYMLYGVRRKCNCSEALFVDSFILRHNSDDSIISISENYDILQDKEVISKSNLNYGLQLRDKTQQICSCGEKYQSDVEIPYYQRYYPIAVVGECTEHGIFFSSPRQTDLDMISDANLKRSNLGFTVDNFTIIPGPKSGDLVRHGVQNYLSLFSSRQLLFLRHAIDGLVDIELSMRLKFAMLVSTSTEFNSMLCGYKGAGKNRPGAIRHTFAHHAYSLPYTALENNPLHRSRSSGTLWNLFQSRIVRGQKWAEKPQERIIRNGKTEKVYINGEVDFGKEYKNFEELEDGTRRFLLLQGSSVALDLPDQSIDHIITDPPYFDNVQYSDLSAFFRVWLKELLPNQASRKFSLDDAAVDQHANGNGQFKAVLSGIFAECNRVLKTEKGRLIFTFHHWNPKGWAALTIALKNAGFALVNRYVIHAENPTSVHIVNQNAILHDVVLVLGKFGSLSSTTWKMPKEINSTNSYDFCKDSGELLGYLLNSDLIEDQIYDIWNKKLS